MTEEIKTEEKKECECGCDCKCEALKKFLLMVLASFLGTLVALCLFTAAIKPKMPPMPQMRGPVPMQQFEHGKFDHNRGGRPNVRIRRIDANQNFEGERMHPQFDKAQREPERDPFKGN